MAAAHPFCRGHKGGEKGEAWSNSDTQAPLAPLASLEHSSCFFIFYFFGAQLLTHSCPALIYITSHGRYYTHLTKVNQGLQKWY